MPNLGRVPRADRHLRNGGCRCRSQAVRQPWFADPRRQPVHPEGRIRRRLSPKIGTNRMAELMAVTQPTVQPAMGCDVEKVCHRRSFLEAFRSRQRMPSDPSLNRRNHCRAGILRTGLGFKKWTWTRMENTAARRKRCFRHQLVPGRQMHRLVGQ